MTVKEAIKDATKFAEEKLKEEKMENNVKVTY